MEKQKCNCQCHRKDWVGGKCTGCIFDKVNRDKEIVNEIESMVKSIMSDLK